MYVCMYYLVHCIARSSTDHLPLAPGSCEQWTVPHTVQVGSFTPQLLNSAPSYSCTVLFCDFHSANWYLYAHPTLLNLLPLMYQPSRYPVLRHEWHYTPSPKIILLFSNLQSQSHPTLHPTPSALEDHSVHTPFSTILAAPCLSLVRPVVCDLSLFWLPSIPGILLFCWDPILLRIPLYCLNLSFPFTGTSQLPTNITVVFHLLIPFPPIFTFFPDHQQ